MKQKVAEQRKNLESANNCPRFGSSHLLTVVGGVALVAAGYLLIRSIPDIRRYLKIMSM